MASLIIVSRSSPANRRQCPLLDQSGHWSALALNASVANDPQRTSPLGFSVTGTMEHRAGSVRLGARELDHLSPLLGFVGDELTEVSGRTREHRAAEVDQPRLDFGVGDSRIDFLVELLDDLGRCVLGCAYAKPRGSLVARHEIAHGREIRQHICARRRGYCQWAQSAGSD